MNVWYDFKQGSYTSFIKFKIHLTKSKLLFKSSYVLVSKTNYPLLDHYWLKADRLVLDNLTVICFVHSFCRPNESPLQPPVYLSTPAIPIKRLITCQWQVPIAKGLLVPL